MSRAFVRESDDQPEIPLIRPASTLPPGAKNYLTPEGAAKLQEELARLVELDRPRLAASSDNPNAKRQLLILNQRIEELEQSLQSAEIIEAPEGKPDTVRFGATVTVRNRSGEESTYRIVGVDEMDLDRNWITWQAPIAKALMNAQRGERVRFKFPSGEEDLEIVGISYP